MRRLMSEQRDRGATAITVALSMLVLFGFIGLSVDVGAAFAKRQEAQNGADAAAIAVASECLISGVRDNCPGDYAAAESIALANERTGDTARVDPGAIAYDTPEDLHVTVTVTAEQQAWFLPAVSDLETFTVRRAATANYGSLIHGTTTLPLAAGNCIFPEGPMEPDDVVEGVEIWLPPNSGSNPDEVANDCRPGFPSGGFAWLQKAADGEDCTAEIGIDDTVISNPGAPPPNECDGGTFAQMALNQEIVHIPLFDISGGGGAGGFYEVTRFAIFQVTGFHSQQGWVDDSETISNPGNGNPDPTWCRMPPAWAVGPSGSLNYEKTTCFRGNLLGFHDDPGDFQLGWPFTENTYVRLVS